MVNVLSFYLEDHVHLAETIKLLDNDSSSSVQLDNGHICLLKLSLFEWDAEIQKCVDSFSKSNFSFLTNVLYVLFG